MRSILSTHESDPRLSDGTLKNRVASLYLPLIGIIMDVRMNICDPYLYQNARNSFCGGVGMNPKIAMAISGITSSDSSDSPFKGSESETSIAPKYILPIPLSRQVKKLKNFTKFFSYSHVSFGRLKTLKTQHSFIGLGNYRHSVCNISSNYFNYAFLALNIAHRKVSTAIVARWLSRAKPFQMSVRKKVFER